MIAEKDVNVPQILDEIITQSDLLDRNLYTPDSTVVHIFKEFGPQLGVTHFNILGLWIGCKRQIPYNYTVEPTDYVQYSVDDEIYAHIYVILNILNSAWDIAIEHDRRFTPEQRAAMCTRFPKIEHAYFSDWAQYDDFMTLLRTARDIMREYEPVEELAAV